MTEQRVVNQNFAANKKGTDYIVGDIHGCFTKLTHQLEAMKFDPTKDRLFSVGDLVDRGDESADYVNWLNYPWFHAVKGNHELMGIMFAEGNLRQDIYETNGGKWNTRNGIDLLTKHAEIFRAMPLTITLQNLHGTIGIVHADVLGNNWHDFIMLLSAEKNDRGRATEHALWSRKRISVRYEGDIVEGVDAVAVGHTPLRKRLTLGNIHYLDNGAWHPSVDDDFIIVKAEDLL